MGRKRDHFWDHADKLNGHFKCNYCKREFPGGASRIKSHLAGVKGRDIVICEVVPDNVRKEAYEATEGRNKKLKGASTSSNAKEGKITLTPISNDDILHRRFEKSTEEYEVEIVLSDIVEGLLTKLRSIVTKHMSSEWDFNEALIDLLASLTQIQLLLNDAEKRQVSDGCVRMWLTDFRDVAYDIDDALDEFGYNILQQKVCSSYSVSNHIVFPFNMANKVKTINKSLNGLKDKIACFDLRVEFVNSVSSIPEINLKKEIDSFLDDPKNMAQIMETPPQYELKELSESDCCSLFEKRAFANKRLFPPDLVNTGWEIAKKCRRVPWALRVLGGTMYFKHDISEWLSIQKNKIWDLLDDDNNGVFRVLKLSFDHLPTQSLKRCFAYCAIFPKDYEMEKEELIQHWMAEGFLEPSKESNMEMEDIGNMYFNILLATSFFQNAKKDAYGNITSCKMDDLVYDFAFSISKSETQILEGELVNNVRSHVRHLYFHYDVEPTPSISFTDGFTKLRIFVSDTVEFGNMLSNFRCLRVLELIGCEYGVIELSDSIGELIHLRLLNFSSTQIGELPKSISKLYNLQTLIINNCEFEEYLELPEDFSNLINLRHIDIDSITKTPKDIGRLTCLQTLPRFYVDEDEGGQIKELGCLNQLRGELDIYNLEYVRDKEEARSANLATKAKIYKLGFYWDYRRKNDNHEEVLEGLQPHQNLKSLTIEWYQGKKFPSWMLTSRDPGFGLSLYDNLIEITLSHCIECEEVPTLGHLPCLRVLQIAGMSNVKCIGNEFYSDGNYRNALFPALKILELNYMYSLEEWQDAEELTTGEGEVFPCLEELTIKDCSKLKSTPDLRGLHSLTKLVIIDCPQLTHLLDGFDVMEAIPEWSGYFSSLQSLSLSNFSSRQSLSLSTFSSLQSLSLSTLSSLQALSVSNLSSLQSLSLTNLSSLQSLSLTNLSSLQSLSLTNLSSLQSLSLTNFSSLQSLSLTNLSSIQSLSLTNLSSLQSLSLSKLSSLQSLFSSLQSLSLSNCKNLKSIPDLRGLHSLTKLVIFDCPQLTHLLDGFLDCFTHLKTLCITGFGSFQYPFGFDCKCLNVSLSSLELNMSGNLNSLPDNIQRFTALKELHIMGFFVMEALPEWLGNFSSLQSLSLNYCMNLMDLSTVEAMRSLTKLDIIHCPKLKERYAKGSSAESSKIAHIQDITIDGERY